MFKRGKEKSPILLSASAIFLLALVVANHEVGRRREEGREDLVRQIREREWSRSDNVFGGRGWGQPHIGIEVPSPHNTVVYLRRMQCECHGGQSQAHGAPCLLSSMGMFCSWHWMHRRHLNIDEINWILWIMKHKFQKHWHPHLDNLEGGGVERAEQRTDRHQCSAFLPPLLSERGRNRCMLSVANCQESCLD